jgi:hypothetical protein
MLIDDFLCKREVLGKRAPHSFTTPLSVVGVSNNLVSEWAFTTSLNKIERRSIDTQMDDEVPLLDEENYSTWRIEMRVVF